MNKSKEQEIENLYKAILGLKNTGEAKSFFRDLLTEKEIEEFTNRFLAAKMLFQNETYEKIEKKTGLSSRTIARISKWLKNGTGGYNIILKRISQHHSSFTRGKS